ncbi:signal peptidase I [Sphingomonas sp. HF-S3]|uniref:Signal peptidase I n=1 Tax=Sphingomonas rustica TaxID=3103142 RepID=A0ABV0B902_9SPHN
MSELTADQAEGLVEPRHGQKRGSGARIGLALLNIPAFGAGLVRAGRVRLGLGFFAAQLAIGCYPLLLFLVPRFGSAAYFTVVAVVIAQVALLIASIVLTLRLSGVRGPETGLSSWPVVGAMVVLGLALNYLAPSPVGRFKTYSIPSENMDPLLKTGDYVVADLRLTDPKRGQVLVFRMEEDQWVKRVVGLPGDRVALRDGVVILNGQPVPQTDHGGYAQVDAFGQRRTVRAKLEQFPGEAAPHVVLDRGAQPQDHFSEVLVPAGHIFVLGDNRDNSMDSRFPREFGPGGVGMLPVSDVRGVLQFFAWSEDPDRRFKTLEEVQARTAGPRLKRTPE